MEDSYFLTLLSEEITIKEIMNRSGLSFSQVERKIISFRNKGYDIKRIDGIQNITYKLMKNKAKKHNIFIARENTFDFIALSDSHNASDQERLDLLNNLYEYGSRNSIHHFFHCGDFKENNFYSEDRKSIAIPYFNSNKKAVDHIVKKYPKDKNIATHIIYGNHDEIGDRQESFASPRILEQKRLDLDILGIRYGFIEFFGNLILLLHPQSFQQESIDNYIENISNKKQESIFLTLCGHLHESGYKRNENRIDIKVPSICGYEPYKQGAWQFRLVKTEEYIKVISKPLILEPEVYPITTIEQDIKIKTKRK